MRVKFLKLCKFSRNGTTVEKANKDDVVELPDDIGKHLCNNKFCEPCDDEELEISDDDEDFSLDPDDLLS